MQNRRGRCGQKIFRPPAKATGGWGQVGLTTIRGREARTLLAPNPILFLPHWPVAFRQIFLGPVHTHEAGLLDDYDVHVVNLVNLLNRRLYRVVEIVDWSLLGLHKAMPILHS